MNLLKIKNQLSKFNTMIIKGRPEKLEKYRTHSEFAFTNYMDLFTDGNFIPKWTTKEARLQYTAKWLRVLYQEPKNTKFYDPKYGPCKIIKIKSMFEFTVNSKCFGIIDFNILKLPITRPIFRLINA